MTPQETQFLGIIINSAIAVVAIATLIYQRRFNIRTLDYNLHPVFKVKIFGNCRDQWTPMLCEAADPNSKHFCTDDHWFDIHNISTGYAFNFNCMLLHNKEVTDEFKLSSFKDRIAKRETLIQNGRIQYKIPPTSLPFKYYNKSATEEMFIVVEYKTVNSLSKFRQIISLTTKPLSDTNQITDWKDAIQINFPEVSSLKKIYWWQNNEKSLLKELQKVKNNNG